MAGGILFFVLKAFEINNNLLSIVVAVFMIVLRILAVRYRWSLQPVERK
jgi:uncharacterized membrane protein YeiH